MKVNVTENILSNNRISVTLDIRNNGIRIQKRLKGIEYANIPRTAAEREHKKDQKELVKKIIAKMQLDSLYTDYLLDNGYELGKNFFDYAAEFMDRKAPISEIRTYRAVTNSFKKWCEKEILPCGSITETMMIDFKDYLESKLNGVSAHNYFKKLKRIFKEATTAKYFKSNPTENIINKKCKSAEKDTLTISDIKILAATSCSNIEVKNAFLFCCLTGLRFCDVKILKWSNIKDGCMDLVQVKTKERLLIQLRADTLKLIGKPKNGSELIFRLPTHTGCLKHLKQWVTDAKIEKHITFHCARHSYACNLLEQDVDVLTVSKLLGHKSILQTQTYLRVSDIKKLSAINIIPQIF
ncbi:MAG: site-specific integrase [Bacteroidetes bacterium]|nr:site-specific integrase [Bacteroidota bacterium]